MITEVSYNYDETPNRPYRAEVEFIPKDDWSSELDILFEELVNGNQLCSTYRDTSTEAGIAYAKIRAVYPDLTLEMLVKSSRRQLENRAAVRDVLGTTRTMAFKTAKDLYTTLQKYLDSKEKHPRSKAKINKDEIALWPLIKGKFHPTMGPCISELTADQSFVFIVGPMPSPRDCALLIYLAFTTRTLLDQPLRSDTWLNAQLCGSLRQSSVLLTTKLLKNFSASLHELNSKWTERVSFPMRRFMPSTPVWVTC